LLRFRAGLNKKKRSKEKSKGMAGRRLVLWQAPALFAIMIFKGC
jgi:hypothetical protein